jgi:hypothetical protein
MDFIVVQTHLMVVSSQTPVCEREIFWRNGKQMSLSNVLHRKPVAASSIATANMWRQIGVTIDLPFPVDQW